MVAVVTRNRVPKNEFVQMYSKDGVTKAHSTYRWAAVTSLFAFAAGLLVTGIVLEIHVMSQMDSLKREMESNKVEMDNLCRQYKHGHEMIKEHKEMDERLSHVRSRRQTGDAFIGAHVVGQRGRTSRNYAIEQIHQPNSYFQWNSSDDNLSVSYMSVDVVHESFGTFLRIRKDGFYYVYSQVTYSSFGMHSTGHETVRKVGSTATVLMQTVAMQVLGSAKLGKWNRMRNMDSGYQGGVFMLFEDDLIGVRPALSEVANQHFRMEKIKSYFGLYFLHV